MTTSQRLGAVLLAAATATGCATNGQPGEKSWIDQQRDALAQAISTKTNASQTADGQGGTGTTSATTTTAAPAQPKGPGVTWNDQSCKDKLSGGAFALAGRQAVASLSSLNGECIAVRVSDTTRNTKVQPVIHYGKISLESCSPDLVAKATSGIGSFVTGLLGQAGAAGGQIVGNAVGNVGGGALGGVGNVARTQAQRSGTEAANAAAGQVKGSIAGLTPEQNTNCAADTKTVSDAIKADVKGFETAFVTANKGAKPITTYSATADISPLNLGVTAAPSRAPSR